MHTRYAPGMALKDLTSADAVHRALAEYDEIGQEAFLQRYRFRPAQTYFLVHEAKKYDSKAIVGAAHYYQHGMPMVAASFSGGDATVAKKLESLGFEVERPKRSPDWSQDELLLALDMYLSTREEFSYNPNRPEIAALSAELRNLTVFPVDIRSAPLFRNPTGVAMKLHNFAAIDPDHKFMGMAHGGRGDQRVWDEWAHRPAELAEVVQQIRTLGVSGEAAIETEEPEEYEAEEGRILYRRHRAYERDRSLVKRKKEQVLKATGRLACEACDFDSGEVYGSEVSGVVDVHHVVPLHKIGQSTTRMSDLAILCPTCHRMVHAHRPFITPAELRQKRHRVEH